MDNLINNIDDIFLELECEDDLKNLYEALNGHNWTQKKERLFSNNKSTNFMNKSIFRTWKDSNIPDRNYVQDIQLITLAYKKTRKIKKTISKEIQCKSKTQKQVIDELNNNLIEKDKEISIIKNKKNITDIKYQQALKKIENLESELALVFQQLNESKNNIKFNHKNIDMLNDFIISLKDQINQQKDQIKQQKEQIDLMKYLKNIIQ